MGPKNGLDRCQAHDDIQELRVAVEEDLGLSRDIHALLNIRVTELISTIDRINETLMKVFFYGVCFAGLAWAVDHFGVEGVAKLIDAVKAEQ